LSLCSYLALHEDISFSECIVPCNLSLTIVGEYSALSSATLSLCDEPIAHWTVGVVDPKAGLDAAKKSIYGNQTSIPPIVQPIDFTILPVFWLKKDHLSSF
jgi:hypothetical protein